MKVIDSWWTNTAQGTFGFVVGENDRGERKLYAGVVIGFNQAANEQAILDWGNKVDIPELLSLINKTVEGLTIEQFLRKEVKSGV